MFIEYRKRWRDGERERWREREREGERDGKRERGERVRSHSFDFSIELKTIANLSAVMTSSL